MFVLLALVDSRETPAVRSFVLALVISAFAIPVTNDRPGSETITARVRALEVPPVRPGEQGELSLLLLELPELDLPLSVRIEADALELAENRLGWSAVVDPQALQPRLRARFTAPTSPGSYTVAATVDYSVCKGDWCRRKHGRVEWQIEVAELDR